MALLNAKLYVKRNGEAAVPCNLYSTTEEVGGEYVTVTASNTKAYAKLGGTSDAFCTQARVKKGTNTYAILSQATPPYNKIEYRTPGTYTVTFPVGVTTAKSTVAGAGGGGGGASGAYSGGAGGRGNLIVNTQAVISAKPYSIHVGAGGTGGAGVNGTFNTASDGNNGETSSALGITAIGGGGGKGGGIKNGDGSAGISYGSGGIGGVGGKASNEINGGGGSGSSGNNGWVIIEYGGDI